MDISRVLRPPGFANRKYNELFLVRAIQETDAIYHRHDFAEYEESPEGGVEPFDVLGLRVPSVVVSPFTPLSTSARKWA